MQSFLSELGLDQYAHALEGEGYDTVEDLANLSLAELMEEPISMKKGHAKRILKEFSKRVAQTTQVTQPRGPARRGGQAPRQYHGQKKNVSLLLFGETGVGKSTLLQSLGDFINGTQFGEHRRTDKVAAMGQSQTQDSDLLNFNNQEWNVDIIDTPGLGDTRGMSVDESHISNLQDFLADKEFNAVCILIKRGTTRSVALLNYVVNELKANMPKEVANHFIVVMTRAEVPVPDEDTLAVIRGLDLPIENIIPVNNIAYEEMDLSAYGNSQNSALVRSVVRKQKTNYFENHESLQALLELAHGFEPYQGNNVVELKVKRDKLRERVALLSVQMDNSTKLELEFEKQKRELAAAEGDIDKARRAIEKTDTYIEYIPYKLNGKVTTHCNACNKACHIDCGLSYGDNLTGCCAMSGSSCNECGHSVHRHTHLGWGQREETRVRHFRDEEKVREMSDAQSVARAVEQRQNQLTRDLENLRARQEEATEEIRLLYGQLSKIAILGWNDSYEKYMLECKRAVEEDPDMPAEAKQKKVSLFQAALAKVEVFKNALGSALFGE